MKKSFQKKYCHNDGVDGIKNVHSLQWCGEKGFTMIELLVGLTLFVTVISIASGTFIQSLRSQRSIVALMAANDAISLALEQMTREMRTGSVFSLDSTKKTISFFNQEGEEVSYRYDEVNKTLLRNDSTITSDNVSVVNLFFELQGDEIGDGQSTRINIRLSVSPRESVASGSVTHLQTTVSSRQLDT